MRAGPATQKLWRIFGSCTTYRHPQTSYDRYRLGTRLTTRRHGQGPGPWAGGWVGPPAAKARCLVLGLLRTAKRDSHTKRIGMPCFHQGGRRESVPGSRLEDGSADYAKRTQFPANGTASGGQETNVRNKANSPAGPGETRPQGCGTRGNRAKQTQFRHRGKRGKCFARR